MIASVLGVADTRAAAIAAEYPLSAYPSPSVAFSALVSDANFACPALQIDRWTSKWVPTFAYESDDDNAPLRYPPPLTGIRHGSTATVGAARLHVPVARLLHYPARPCWAHCGGRLSAHGQRGGRSRDDSDREAR